MATLAADSPRVYEVGDRNELPLIAADIVFEGAAVGEGAGGDVRPLVAGDSFRGFAESKADNSTGAAAAIRVRLRTTGLIELLITALAKADEGKDVYASDDDTFTLTKGTNTRIGYVYRFVATGKGIIAFSTVQSKEAELVDSSTGTAAASIVDAGAVYSQANTNNNFASLAAKINTLIRRLGN